MQNCINFYGLDSIVRTKTVDRVLYVAKTHPRHVPDLAAIGTTWVGHAQTNDLPMVEVAETRTNYAPHVSGKDIQNRNSMYGQIFPICDLFGVWPGGGRDRGIFPKYFVADFVAESLWGEK